MWRSTLILTIVLALAAKFHAEQLEGSYELSNARFPNHFAYINVLGDLKVTRFHSGASSNFTIETKQSEDGHFRTLLVSDRYPKHSLGFSVGPSTLRKLVDIGILTYELVNLFSENDTEKMIREVVTSGGALADLKGHVCEPRSIPTHAMTKAGDYVSSLLVKAPVEEGEDGSSLVMISAEHCSGSYLYVPTTSWDIKVYNGHPGAGGYWRITPPLPEEVWAQIPEYTGPACEFNCGKVQQRSVESTAEL